MGYIKARIAPAGPQVDGIAEKTAVASSGRRTGSIVGDGGTFVDGMGIGVVEIKL